MRTLATGTNKMKVTWVVRIDLENKLLPEELYFSTVIGMCFFFVLVHMSCVSGLHTQPNVNEVASKCLWPPILELAHAVIRQDYLPSGFLANAIGPNP